MKAVEIKSGIYWVGFVDWNLREFHGYTTPRGTTYNAYLIIDDEITLIDTVKSYGYEQMMQRISSIIDPDDIDNLVVNHIEPDHSGSFTKVLNRLPDVKVITSQRAKDGLFQHYGENIEQFDYDIVNSGESRNIGEMELQFIHVPMVHWPDSMVTYVPGRNLLLSNDAFGQHLATSERFDEEVGWGVLEPEAAKYYANIVLPYSERVVQVLQSLGDLDLDMIAPSHGVIWTEHIDEIVGAYHRWANHETKEKAVIVYDTMWGSTEQIAVELLGALQEMGIPVVLRSLQTTHRSDVIFDILESRMILVGSPTLNRNMLPSVSGFLTYMRGLQPKDRLAFAFGSYGWSGEGAEDVHRVLSEMGLNTPVEPININYVPDEDDLKAKVKGKLQDLVESVKTSEEQQETAENDEEVLSTWVCKVCGYEYDPQKGDEQAGVSPGTAFEDLPDDWVCPVCGADKSQFEKVK